MPWRGASTRACWIAQVQPALGRAWAALVACVDADGKLTHVQPDRRRPKKFAPESTEIYGVGAFLLAGSEIYRLAVLKQPPIPNHIKNVVKVEVTDPAYSRAIAKPPNFETQIFEREAHGYPFGFAVMDGTSSRILDSQAVHESSKIPNTLLFQVDLAPGETRTFYVLDASSWRLCHHRS